MRWYGSDGDDGNDIDDDDDVGGGGDDGSLFLFGVCLLLTATISFLLPRMVWTSWSSCSSESSHSRLISTIRTSTSP